MARNLWQPLSPALCTFVRLLDLQSPDPQKMIQFKTSCFFTNPHRNVSKSTSPFPTLTVSISLERACWLDFTDYPVIVWGAGNHWSPVFRISQHPRWVEYVNLPCPTSIPMLRVVGDLATGGGNEMECEPGVSEDCWTKNSNLLGVTIFWGAKTIFPTVINI